MGARIDPKRALRRLYRGVDGFEIPRADVRRVARSKGSPTYGELMPTATLRLLAELELRPEDRFVDLGAGVGKVVLLAAMHTKVGEARGIELSPKRVALATQIFARARAEGIAGIERASMCEADMLRAPLADATVIYTCSTAFSSAFMRKLQRRLATLPRLRKLVSLQDFDPHPAFDLAAIHKLDASWKRKTKVYVYERKRPST